jgi:hypothetical protein
MKFFHGTLAAAAWAGDPVAGGRVLRAHRHSHIEIMMSLSSVRAAKRLLVAAIVPAIVACGDDSPNTQPTPNGESILLTSAMLDALDSTGEAIVTANPGNPHLQSLVDSTLEAITAGIEARSLAVTTNLTTEPLYFLAIHNVAELSTGSWSAWKLVGFDDPSAVQSILHVGGFAQSTGATPPASVTGTVGSGFVNSLMLQVGSGGAVTEWHAGSGTVSFISGSAGSPCPNFVPPNPAISCALETIRVAFNVSAAGGSGGAGARSASLTEVEVPAIRLTYRP